MAAPMKEHANALLSWISSQQGNFWGRLSSRDVESTKKIALDMVASNESQIITRKVVLVKLLSTCLGLTVSLAISYFGIKWLSEALDPTRKEKKEAQLRAQNLMKKIGVSGVKLSEYELCIASNLVDPLGLTISWDDIGGLDDAIKDIQETVILPFQKADLFLGSKLMQPPKGVLLHGPPGCGKTLIAKATAKAAGARFINLQVSSLVDKWYGESQKRAEAVFSLALKIQPVIIFIDEIDSFLRSRSSTDHEATAMIKTQFMSFWDGLMTDSNCQVMIMGATNRPQDVDAAILRRMPSMFRVGLPNAAQRRNILDIILNSEKLSDDVELDDLANKTEGYSGSDLRELCRSAAIFRIRGYIRAEERKQEPEEITGDNFHDCNTSLEDCRMIYQADFNKALVKMRQGKGLATLTSIQQSDLD